MNLMEREVPAPGQGHPALVEYLPTLRSYRGRDRVLIPIQHSVTWKLGEEIGPESAAIGVHTLTPSKAAQGFYPDLGMYFWVVWTDELGRSIADTEVEWIDNPNAPMAAPFNPVRAKAHPATRQGRFNRSCPVCGLSIDAGFMDSNGGDHWTMHRV